MKLTGIILAYLLVVARTGCAQEPAASASDFSSVKKKLIQIEHDWAEALVKRDLTVWTRCLSDDWIGTTPDGDIVTKAGAYADLKAGLVVRELFRLDDLKVRAHGDMAIVFGLETEKSKIHGKDRVASIGSPTCL